jgi:CheY-like chemotaxis protein
VEKPFVLLADDNEATCTLITALLQKDFNVDVANNGSEAMQRLESRPYAAVLLDLVMPVVDGWAVLAHIAAHWPDLMRCVLIVTAATGTRDLQRVRNYGVFGVVSKPFDIEELLDTVKRCAGGNNASLHAPIVSGGMLLLLADFLRYRWM